MNVFGLIQMLTLHLILVAAVVKPSGIYVDNGYDKTVFQEITNEGHRKYLREEILNVLDIPIDTEMHQQQEKLPTAASSFLMDIYHLTNDDKQSKMLRDQELKKLQYFDVNDVGMNSIIESDLITTLAARNSKKPNFQKTDKVKRLWFNVSRISTDDTITRGELKLFRTIDNVSKKNRGMAIIRVYRIASDRDNNGNRDMIFVDSVNTTESDGWVTLNVTESLHFWLRGLDINRGLYLEAYSHGGEENIRPEAIGIVGFKGVPEKRPFLVVYGNRNTARRRRGLDYFHSSMRKSFQSIAMAPRLPMSCRKETLYVSFRDLSLDNIIIAPKGYDAFYCNGPCNYPLNFNMNATNHAIIQSFINLKYPDRAPKPCCAPSKTSTIHVIFRTSEDTLVIKKREDMTVDSCGCL
ncbi:protein 60A-like [Leptopilina boulardi]|uniref:protein 60A-like n=1 Tax=Leptopilina boulardi TaxID=63433 RepID=UPI0021F505BE|nr:protein 60A-like [Leptopilina boulardi]